MAAVSGRHVGGTPSGAEAEEPKAADRRDLLPYLGVGRHYPAGTHALPSRSLRKHRRARQDVRKGPETACDRALEIGARSYSSVNSILKSNVDQPTTRNARLAARDHARRATSAASSTYFH